MSEHLQHNPEVFKSQESISQQIDTVYWELDWFSDFKSLLDVVDPNLRSDIEWLLVLQKDNEELIADLDWFEDGQFPSSPQEIRALIEKYNTSPIYVEKDVLVEKEKQTNISAETDREEEVQTQISAETDREEEVQTNISAERKIFIWRFKELLNNIKNHNIPGLNIPNIDFNDINQVEDFVENNLPTYLKTAKNHSPGALRAVYREFQSFATESSSDFPEISTSILAQLELYEVEVLVADPETPWDYSDVEEVKSALWDSSIAAVSGDTIKGDNGEVINISWNTVHLSLEWAEGLTLEVWDIWKIDTRKQKLEIFQLEHQISRLQSKISKNEGILQQHVLSQDTAAIENEEQTDSYFDRLISSGLDRRFIEQVDEADIFWQALLDAITTFIENTNARYQSDITTFEMQVWALKAWINTKQKIAAEKVKEKKEKVQKTIKFLESIGIHLIPQSLLNGVIEQINRNPKEYGFDIKIDLSNWELGMDKIIHEWSLLLVNKKAFAEMMNKMIWVDAINVWLIGSWAPVWDRNKFQNQLKDSRLLDVWWLWVAMRNLQQSDTIQEQ